jgi:predicted ATP-dependent endonuclease of OLD family
MRQTFSVRLVIGSVAVNKEGNGMYISRITVQNFRLLKNIEMEVERRTTVIVGRNNSGKTSLTELFRRLLDDKGTRFKLEDFSLGVHEQFWAAFEKFVASGEEPEIRKSLPTIEIGLTIDYRDNAADLSLISDFVVDLDPTCTKAKLRITYGLAEGKISTLFADLKSEKGPFFKTLRERIPELFKLSLEAVDPTDATNTKPLDMSSLRSLLQSGFINAQRAVDDTTRAEKAVLGKVLEALFTAAASATAAAADRDTAEELRRAVATIQDDIDADFNEQLGKLIPAFTLFGYPGLSDPKLRTETTLKVEQLLSNHTSVGYEGINGINLPESYNGLGPRNLIFILLRLVEFFRSFTAKQPAAAVHIVFVEEPEAHLHPQMQNVFIRKLGEIASLFEKEYNDGNAWPVQFIVTTHSSHIANEASFDSMRYFMAHQSDGAAAIRTTEVKDLRFGLSNEEPENRAFLHKYMTLTRCDLLFADRGVLVEGPTERLLLPRMIEKVDAQQSEGARLSSQYVSVMEVGGAYAHIFFNLLEFLRLRTLVITDLDTVDQGKGGSKCRVSAGTHSSNACINHWYSGSGEGKPTKESLLQKHDGLKVENCRRLAYQIPHTEGAACGRSFEDAFMLANAALFAINGTTAQEQEEQAWVAASSIGKTSFALEYAIQKLDWEVPRYIADGLRWLAQHPSYVIPAEVILEAALGSPAEQAAKESKGG